MSETEILVLDTPMRATHASSREQLAAVCGVSVSTIARALASGKSPGKKQNGSYDIEAWSDFLKHNEIEPDELYEIKRRRQLAAVELEELKVKKHRLEIAEKEGTLVDAQQLFVKEHARIERIFNAVIAAVKSAFPENHESVCTEVQRIFTNNTI